jgi:hypothetical protein
MKIRSRPLPVSSNEDTAHHRSEPITFLGGGMMVRYVAFLTGHGSYNQKAWGGFLPKTMSLSEAAKSLQGATIEEHVTVTVERPE